MGVEKDGSKSGGGYVGGFFQLFDWTAKSRKKLFSSKSDLPERTKQGKRSDGNLPMTRLHLVDDEETVGGASIKGGSDYSCASSVTDDDAYGAKAPGVVARLMGLDSLPTSNSSESYSTPFFDTQSLRDAHYCRKNLDYHHDHQIMYSGNLRSNVEGPSMEFLESKPQRTISRPIEKFQTEVLPPKSAKSIPVTHHKLLSPIKSPGFIPARNVAHIMEAAAKIIEPGPQATAKMKMPLVGSSSGPLKIRDLKEKVEAAPKMPVLGSSVPLKDRDLKERVESGHKTSRLPESSRRPVESNAVKYLKGQSLNKSWNGSESASFGASPAIEEGPSGLKDNGKSISLAIQAKVNVQRREGLSSSNRRSSVGQKEQNEAKPSQTFKNQPNLQRNFHKKSSTHNGSSALRPNNQKQNCQMDKEKLPSKPSVSSMQGRKVLSGDSSVARLRSSNKTVGVNKSGSKKSNLDLTEGISHPSTKSFPRKRRSIDDFEKSQMGDNMLTDRNPKMVQSNAVYDRHSSWLESSKKNGMDVVSFTFTAPLTRSMSGSETTDLVAQRNGGTCMDSRAKRLLLETDTMKLSSLGYNVIGGDTLSMLLEQKLRELSSGIHSPHHDSFKLGSPSSSGLIFQNLVPTSLAGCTIPRLHDKSSQNLLPRDKFGSCLDSNSTDSPVLRSKYQFQGVDEMDECSSNHADAVRFLDCRHPSPVSILEPFPTESCNSSDSTDTSSLTGPKQCSSVQAQEVLGLSSLKRFHRLEADVELSDSASSSSIGTAGTRNTNTQISTDLMISTKWELDYLKEILCNIEFKFKDFALGRAREIINPHLFDLLENRKGGFGKVDGDRLKRKVLFDCVSECLDIRCRRYVGGGCRTWAKGMAMVRRKDWLAEEVHKEVSRWREMVDCMVDELVEKDMSSQFGKWVDFEVDELVIGVEVETEILNSLVDEVVADLFKC